VIIVAICDGRGGAETLLKPSVRFGSKADISQRKRYVRFTLESGHWSVGQAGWDGAPYAQLRWVTRLYE
jgi:hypothetical protein